MFVVSDGEGRAAVDVVPWEAKSPLVSFHGSGFGDCDENHESNQRERFCGYVTARKEQWEEALNISINIGNDFVSPSEEAKSKFLILLDGSVAAFRSTWYLSTGSVILATGVHVDIRTSLLIPYVHYVPFKPDFSDFFEQLSMIAGDDQYAEWIGHNARELSRKLSMNTEGRFDNGFTFDKLYWAKMLEIYNKTFSFIDDNLDADLESNFTKDRSCETFDDGKEGGSKHVCFKDRAYACDGVLQRG
eukprot:CAMPEP_0202456870 /NCGR_PEP_ID=MMETSP1360-20130828/14028_1 /ASSEMBLY_ACC=CAM_ASM_000848 /TAXON_ID=515479 /ORGANISM="Licmophora paradoxa, Strain CCMP2313" /LENGTH=245 /DNA_ID=CAMNT_0049076813 /DNA_START=439 /DNA_END=1176 /DNA_ORIENTATION=+